jgi:glycosyltransferase involved in cell wall biosynthesis
MDEYHGVPKVQHELDPSVLPFVHYPILNNMEDFIDYLYKHKIPITNLFHIGREDMEKFIDPAHSIGNKLVLHQTIHWVDDDIVTMGNRLRDFDMIVTPTSYAKEVFKRVCRIPEKQLVTIPHAVDTRAFSRRMTNARDAFGIRPDQKIILYSGRLGFWKGLHTIIPIVRDVIKNYDAVFIIRGSHFGDKEGKSLHDVFKRMDRKYGSNFHILDNWMAPAYMEELYATVGQNNGILLFNSGHEGFGVPLIEIQSVEGIPITTGIENHREILGPTGTCGLLLDPTEEVGTVNKGTKVKVASSDAVYGAIKWVLENSDEAQIMGKRGRANVLKRFDLTNTSKAWLRLYDSMLEDYDMDKGSEEYVFNE